MIDTFMILAEFSIGLAGFSGVVALIGNVPLDFLQFRVRNLLYAAFTPGFVALCGILFLHLDLQTESVVRLTSAVFAGVMIFGLITGLRRLRRLDKEAWSLLSRGLFWFNMTVGPANILAQCFSAAFHTPYAEAILVGGLILALLSGAITFAHMVGLLIKDKYDTA